VRAGSSYLSVSDRRASFGLGKAQRVDEVVNRWPSRQRDVLKNLKADTFYTVTEARGVTKNKPPAKQIRTAQRVLAALF
jgi:hypothetical protein